jgi:hypothetical protein
MYLSSSGVPYDDSQTLLYTLHKMQALVSSSMHLLTITYQELFSSFVCSKLRIPESSQNQTLKLNLLKLHCKVTIAAANALAQTSSNIHGRLLCLCLCFVDVRFNSSRLFFHLQQLQRFVSAQLFCVRTGVL